MQTFKLWLESLCALRLPIAAAYAQLNLRIASSDNLLAHGSTTWPTLATFSPLVFNCQCLKLSTVHHRSPTFSASVCTFPPLSLADVVRCTGILRSVGGELVRGDNSLPLNGKVVARLPTDLWIGLTDFVDETGKNKNGWRWSFGALDLPSSNLTWKSGEPSSPTGDDCVRTCMGEGLGCESP